MNETGSRNETKLGDWDIILVNSSAGKDSQAMLDLIVELAKAEGVLERVHVVHAELEEEWNGTKELAAEQAAHYGLPIHYVKRPQGSLLEHVEARGMWPSSTARFCTSDHKRGQVAKVITALAKDHSSSRPRVLNCMGIRALESAARAKKAAFQEDKRNSNGRKEVWTWFPIFDWTEEQVWDRIRRSGVRHHPAYDLGMPRLSCVFCIFAPKAALVLAGQHNPELLDRYVAVEERIGHSFRQDLTLAEVRTACASEQAPVKIESWNM